jgi:hypothetical protein
MSAPGVWKRCKGCGQPIVFFPVGFAPHYPPGAVGHSKPADALCSPGGPSRVTCELYHRLSCAELVELHADAETIEPPERFDPVLG